ncbi:MAG: dTDP-3-amino-3,4,6-trideoxy-alpha-D-glucose transaminase [Myxococcota bacterium]|nr:dTDP-3-amino-3,4,6-trideoxy-alpha-D-glucose transaminase [Myxococcota bacterium]
MSADKIPLLDLPRELDPDRAAIDAAIARVIQSGRFILGPEVEAFETEFAAFSGVPYCAGFSCGTAALYALAWCAGVRPGHEVITTPMSFVATAEAIHWCGARTVFADIDLETLNLNLDAVEQAITPRTKAIVPVHLHGRMVDMRRLSGMTSGTGVLLLEDAAQAHGARGPGDQGGPGTQSAGAVFSFFPGKNLGALGDAGAVVTSDEGLVRELRLIRNHGRSGKFDHNVMGWNLRMDALQAAVLRVRLPRLAAWNQRRQEIAARYRTLLAGHPEIRLPPEDPGMVWHQFAVRVPRRDVVLEAMARRGVECGVHYPAAIHRLGAFSYLGYGEDAFPDAEEAARTVLSLPMFPTLTDQEIGRVCEALTEVVSHG